MCIKSLGWSAPQFNGNVVYLTFHFVKEMVIQNKSHSENDIPKRILLKDNLIQINDKIKN